MAPNSPMATVGKPMPVTPLTMPARRNVKAVATIGHGEGSNMPLFVAILPVPRNADDPNPALGWSEG